MKKCLTMFFFLMGLVVTESCSTRDDRIPDDILKVEEMSTLFYELSMAEAYVENYHLKDSMPVRDSILSVEMDKVLAIHHVDQAQFLRSYDFYKKNPILFKRMVDSAYQKRELDPAQNYRLSAPVQ